MKIEIADINSITPYENNPRKLSDKAIETVAMSLKEYGFRQPIVVDKDRIIVVGHTRFRASKKLNFKEVPITIADNLTPEQINAYRIADNRTSEESDWDSELLKMELKELDLKDFDLELTGFNEDQLNSMLFEEKEGLTDEDAVPELPEEPISKLGDIWKLGNHRVMCGDSLDENKVKMFLNEKKIRLLFTDPPYELITKGGGILKNSNSMKQIKDNNVDSFNPKNLLIYCDTNIYFHNKPLIKLYIELAETNNLTYDLCFYKKINCVPNYGGHMMTDVEYIAIIGKQNPNKGFEKDLYSKSFVGKKDPTNKLSYSKPVELCSKYIKLYADKYVLDLFLGSGSTLIACEKLDRICYGMELDPKYCDVIVKRWEEFTGLKAELENGQN